MRSTTTVNTLQTHEVALIVCDNCNKSLVSSPERWHALPVGTYVVYEVQEDMGMLSNNDKEFCSKKCLVEWCTKEKNAGTDGPSH